MAGVTDAAQPVRQVVAVGHLQWEETRGSVGTWQGARQRLPRVWRSSRVPARVTERSLSVVGGKSRGVSGTWHAARIARPGYGYKQDVDRR